MTNFDNVVDNIFIGTEFKLNLNIEPINNITMDDYDFTVDVYCSNKKVIQIEKKDTLRLDNSNYLLLIDSALLGTGELKCKITAFIPDSDFKGTRTEVQYINTGINIIKDI